MARKRFLSPYVWSDAFFVKLTAQERLLFIGLITLADDEGRLRASPSYLKGEIFPQNGLSDLEVATCRERIVRRNRNIRLYKVGGVEYIQLRNWSKYQSPSHPTPSRLPPPPRFKTAPNAPEGFAKPSRNPPRKPRENDAKDSRNSRDLGMGVGRGGGSTTTATPPTPPTATAAPTPAGDDIATVTRLYEDNIGIITPMVGEELIDITNTYPASWFAAAVKEAVEHNARSLKYVTTILQRWERDGLGSAPPPKASRSSARRPTRPLPTGEELEKGWGQGEGT